MWQPVPVQDGVGEDLVLPSAPLGLAHAQARLLVLDASQLAAAIDAVMEQASREVDAWGCDVALLAPGKEGALVERCWAEPWMAAPHLARLDLSWMFAELRAGRPVVFSHLTQLPPAAARERRALAASHIHSAILAPLRSADAGPLGWIGFVTSLHEHAWTPAQVEAAHHYGGLIAPALLRLRSEQETLATRDLLRTSLDARGRMLERAEARLRGLASELARVQDTERRRIASVLHDGAAQQVFAAVLGVRAARQAGHPASAELGECQKMLEQALLQLRTLSHLLSPPLLDEAGLGPALRAYVDGFSTRSGLVLTLEGAEALARLAPEAERALFRMVQEALLNVLRHSGSACARVRVEQDDTRVHVTVSDEGHGFPVATLRGRPTVGLASMRQSLLQVGGSVELCSGATGTEVRASVPRLPAPPSRGGGRHERGLGADEPRDGPRAGRGRTPAAS
jgi:signal transduction histidine kinase